jgi:hypothetical protein
MSIILFLVSQGLGFLALYLTWKGLFGLGFAFMVVVTMLALSFHVLARDPRPDGTSVRMACFATMLWYGTFLSGKLLLEFRGVMITVAALIAMLLLGTIAAFATWSVIERPLDYDVDEAE